MDCGHKTGPKVIAMLHSVFAARIFVFARFLAMSAVPNACAVNRMRTALCGALALAGMASAALAEPTHAIAMHGKPAMADGFIALPYANPDAPKGGRLVEGVLGTFDSLNPMIVQGLPVQTIRGYVVESLMARSYDEPFTLYGLLARTIDTDDARSSVTFALDPAAHFSDSTPVTAEDVAFSWQLLRDHGRPNYRTYYAANCR